MTGNSETVYGTNFLDLKADGPTVVEVPPRVLGFFNDLWMRPIGDVGMAGPDHGRGGRYLLVPPGHDGEPPEDTGEYVAVLRPRTYLVWFVLRAFMGPGGDAGPAKATLQQVRIYPWAQRQDPPAMRYIYLSPEPPAGFEGNWIRTLPDTGWFPLLRLYGPTEAWFDQSWKPGDLEPIDT